MKLLTVDQLNPEISQILNSRNIVVIDDAMPHDECGSFITFFDQVEIEKTKLSSEFGVVSFDELNISRTPGWENHHAVLLEYAQYYEEVYKSLLHIPKYSWPVNHGFEQFRMKKYFNNDHDRFDQHVDVRDYATARRFLVFFWYLNNVEEGGETAFYFHDVEIRVKPKAGRLIMFPPMWTHPHAGLRPVSGPKYIVGGYLHLI